MKCQRNIKCCMKLLEFMGFKICPEKLNFAPTKCIEYYVFVLSSEDMTIFLSDEKEKKIKLLWLETSEGGFLTIAKLFGKFTSSLPAV